MITTNTTDNTTAKNNFIKERHVEIKSAKGHKATRKMLNDIKKAKEAGYGYETTVGLIFEEYVKDQYDNLWKNQNKFYSAREHKGKEERNNDQYKVDVDFRRFDDTPGIYDLSKKKPTVKDKMLTGKVSVKYFRSAHHQGYIPLKYQVLSKDFKDSPYKATTYSWKNSWWSKSTVDVDLKQIVIGTGNGFSVYDSKTLWKEIGNWFDSLDAATKKIVLYATPEKEKTYYNANTGTVKERQDIVDKYLQVPFSVFKKIPCKGHFTFDHEGFEEILDITGYDKRTLGELFETDLDSKYLKSANPEVMAAMTASPFKA